MNEIVADIVNDFITENIGFLISENEHYVYTG